MSILNFQSTGQIGLFVAVRYGTSGVMTSPDGITWTVRTTPDSNWESVTWSPEREEFLACASDYDSGEAPGTTTNRIMVSTDGVTWTGRSPALTEMPLYAIKWIPALNLYVVAGIDLYATSPDGITWTERTMPDGDAPWIYSIAWSPSLGKICMVGGPSSQYAYTSSDGITWTKSTDIANLAYLGTTWSEELDLFLGANNNQNSVGYSSDGDTWTSSNPSGGLIIRYNGVSWSPELGLFCIVSDDNDETTMGATSPDGTTWTLRTLPSGYAWKRLCWSSELSLFVVTSSGAFATSPDGITWTERAISSTSGWGMVIWAA